MRNYCQKCLKMYFKCYIMLSFNQNFVCFQSFWILWVCFGSNSSLLRRYLRWRKASVVGRRGRTTLNQPKFSRRRVGSEWKHIANQNHSNLRNGRVCRVGSYSSYAYKWRLSTHERNGRNSTYCQTCNNPIPGSSYTSLFCIWLGQKWRNLPNLSVSPDLWSTFVAMLLNSFPEKSAKNPVMRSWMRATVKAMIATTIALTTNCPTFELPTASSHRFWPLD